MIEENNRLCELCKCNINHKNSGARFCCRSHKEKHYRHNNRDKIKKWKRNYQKKNLKTILKNRVEKGKIEKKIYGFTKSYLREYAKRHEQKLIDLKGKQCFKCGEKRFLGMHHTKYTKNPKDWEFVCQLCHIKIHEPTTLL